MVIHGDDFTARGPTDGLRRYREGLEKFFELKVKGHRGEAPGCDREVRVLNRVVRLVPEGLEYEADPRHGEMLVQAGGLALGNQSATPGLREKAEEVDYESVLDEIREREVAAGQLDGDLGRHAISQGGEPPRPGAAAPPKPRSVSSLRQAASGCFPLADVDVSILFSCASGCFPSALFASLSCLSMQPLWMWPFVQHR